MNYFGGNWTEQKIDMVVSYAKAYLTIMNQYPQFKTLYFDGFAGSGDIIKEQESDSLKRIKGAAIRILEIDQPKPFDRYYFVEKNENNKRELEKAIKTYFSNRKYNVVNEDCNGKLKSMAEYLKSNSNQRVLAFIDPYGMALDWDSIKCLKGLGIDLWILVPTGIGVSRLLKNDGDIPDSWFQKLEKFLGISQPEIKDRFYKTAQHHTLFDSDPITLQFKEGNTISKVHELYKSQLLTVFDFVSEAFVMRNKNNSIMYHFMMATNNKTAYKIANDIIKPKYKL